MKEQTRTPDSRALLALTMVEMLVVMAICGILALLLIPFAMKARGNARAVICSNNLKALGQAYAVNLFNSNGNLPDVYYVYQRLGSAYQVQLRTPDRADSCVLTSEVSPSLVCPNDRTPHNVAAQTANGATGEVLSSYAYNVVLPVSFKNIARVPFPVDTVTFFDGDVAAMEGEWQRPTGWQAQVIRTRHNDEANYLYLDGHVEKRGTFSDASFTGGTAAASFPTGDGWGWDDSTTTLRVTTTTQPATTTTQPSPTTTTTVAAVTTTTSTLPPPTTTTTLTSVTTTTGQPSTTTTITLPPTPPTTQPPIVPTTTVMPPIVPTTVPGDSTTTLPTTTTTTITQPPVTTTVTAPPTTTTAPPTTTTTLASVPFIINNGDVIPQQECSATILCVGSQIQYGSGGPRIPVEALYSINDGSRTVITTDVQGGESVTLADLEVGNRISIGGKCMQYISNQFWSDDGSGHTWVLRNGDVVPSIAGYSGQRSVKSYLQNYMDDDGRVTLTVNQCILLFELSSDIDYTRYSWADFQDLVVVITFEQHAVTTTTTTSTTTTTTTLPPGHAVGGRISINPSNSQSVYEFDMALPNGVHITRDDLAGDTPHTGEGFTADWLEYTGPATAIYVKPKGNANQNGMTVDGEPYPLYNSTRYTITSNQMTVHLYNDRRSSKGKALGKWWIEIDAQNATIVAQ